MPTPQQLEQFALDRGWTHEQLADAIHQASGIRVSVSSISRFVRGIGRPKRLTRAALEKFMAAQTPTTKKRQGASAR
jgi:hypothetical protein